MKAFSYTCWAWHLWLVRACICLLLSPLNAQQLGISANPADPFHNEDELAAALKEKIRCLDVLAMKVPHYEIKNATASEALLKLLETTLGEKPKGILLSDDLTEPDKLSEAFNISLQVDNTPGYEIIKLIGELSDCDIQLEGGGVLSFVRYRHVRCACGTEHNFADFLPFEGNAARLLGLKSGMSPQEVIAVLKHFGLGFHNVLDVAIYYPPSDRQAEGLAISTRASDVIFVQSLVRLVNGGAKIELPKGGLSK